MSAADVENLVQTVARLRAPGGCPWDRKQTHLSLRPHLIEEAYELLEVLDRAENVAEPEFYRQQDLNLKEELGDLLMQVLIHSQIAAEKEQFNFYDIARGLQDKLVRRHPHVFGDQTAANADEALQNWEAIKQQEVAEKDVGILSSIPKDLPALQKANKVIQKVTKVGFQWDSVKEPLEKVKEELSEFLVEVEKGKKQRMEAEFGDLLFSLCNIAHFLKIDPELALRNNLARFQKRFSYIEQNAAQPIDQLSLSEMDTLWQEAKRLEKEIENDSQIE